MATNQSAPKPIPWRFLLWTAVFAGFGSAGVYLADSLVLEPRRQQERLIEQKNKEIQELDEKRKELEGFVKRLEHTERRAQLIVLDQQESADQKKMTTFRFTEVDAEGTPLQEYPEFTLEGDEIYVDAFVVKFDDKFIEHGDVLKGKALLLFRRIFSNRLQPDSGYMLDKKGQAPLAYASKEAAGEFERELWSKFWEIPDDPKLREKYGVRAAQSTAAAVKVRKSDVLLIEVRSTGEVTVRKALDLVKQEKPVSPEEAKAGKTSESK